VAGSLNVKGDLGFAELSVTGSYFDRKIKYEWDNSLYDLYRTYNAAYAEYDLYNTGLEIGTTYDRTKQNRYSLEVRLTSKGESRFQWMAERFTRTSTTGGTTAHASRTTCRRRPGNRRNTWRVTRTPGL
jgi:hypothetical protein